MVVNRPDPRKVKPTKLLRDFKRIASEYGFEFAGFNGGQHYVFARDGLRLTAPGTPKNPDFTLRQFRQKCARAS